MISTNFIWVALVVAVLGSLFYVKDTLAGITRPNRVTFFLWGVAPLVSYFAQRSAHGGEQILYTLVVALTPFAIVAASFMNKKAYWAITKFDVACGALSALALIMLLATHNGQLALVLSIIADLAAGLPTVLKSYKYPETETALAYAAEVVSSLIVLLTIQHWVFVDYSFVAYILFMNVLFTTLLIFPRPKTIARARRNTG
ncbi:MAG: hypothetical protein JWN38_601 [Candidatus Saccharibacteria bacterium]|nr:hypothetical protein [Candidatus Saccharibacteria bacterium]